MKEFGYSLEKCLSLNIHVSLEICMRAEEKKKKTKQTCESSAVKSPLLHYGLLAVLQLLY